MHNGECGRKAGCAYYQPGLCMYYHRLAQPEVIPRSLVSLVVVRYISVMCFCVDTVCPL